MDIQSIQKRIDIIENLHNELKTLSEMLKDALSDDPAFSKAEEEKSKFREESSVAKNKVYERSDIRNMINDIKEKKDEVKEARETLSLELIEYYRQNSVLTIEDKNGKVREMKISIKLSNPK